MATCSTRPSCSCARSAPTPRAPYPHPNTQTVHTPHAAPTHAIHATHATHTHAHIGHAQLNANLGEGRFITHSVAPRLPNPNPHPNQGATEGEISGYEIFFWVWALSRQVGEVYELDEFSSGGLRMYIRDFWNPNPNPDPALTLTLTLILP